MHRHSYLAVIPAALAKCCSLQQLLSMSLMVAGDSITTAFVCCMYGGLIWLAALQCMGPLCTAHQARLAANPLIAGMAAPRRRLTLARRFPDFDAPTLQLLTVRAAACPLPVNGRVSLLQCLAHTCISYTKSWLHGTTTAC